MARLPISGSDDGVWGDVLNDYLSQAHDTGGALKANSVGSSQLQANAVTATHVADGALPQAKVQNLVTSLAGKASTTHASTHASAGSDPVTPVSIGAAPTAHTHALRASTDYNDTIAPTNGQAIVWNGAAYAPATVSGGAGNLSQAARYGMVAMSAPPWAVSSDGGTAIALTSQRVYLIRLVVDGSTTITGATMALQAGGTGPGSMFLGAYSQSGNTLTREAITGDEATAFSSGTAVYKSANFLASIPGGSSRIIWFAALSTLASGPVVYYTRLDLSVGISNPLGTTVTAFLNGQTSLPVSIDLTTATVNSAELLVGLT